MEGRHALETVKQTGIDSSHCRVYEGENGCARVTLEDGDRVFLGSNRCGVLRTIGLHLKEEDYAYLQGFDLIHSGLFGFAEEDLKTLKQRGCRISYDFSSEFTEEQLEEMLPYVDYGMPYGHLILGDGCRNLESDLKILKKYGYTGGLGQEITDSKYFKDPLQQDRRNRNQFASYMK
ncbi:MAG: hypothetical protein ACI4EO_04645 [Blautia sp.]